MSKTLQTPWYDKTIDALQLAGMSGSIQEVYARAVRKLIEHFGKDPRQITEEELQEYFLFRRNVTKWSPSKLKIGLDHKLGNLNNPTASGLPIALICRKGAAGDWPML